MASNYGKPPDLQDWIARHGSYYNIPWKEWDDAVLKYQLDRSEVLARERDVSLRRWRAQQVKEKDKGNG